MTGPAAGSASSNVVRLPACPAIQIHRNAAIERVRDFIRETQDEATEADRRGLHEEAERHWQDAEALALVLSLAEGGNR
jgi:hypothetical protein